MSEFLELRTGMLYRFSLIVRKLGGGGGGASLRVQGESMPKDRLRQLALYPDGVVARASDALVRARKVLKIVQDLGLTQRELLYFVSHAAAFDNVDFSALPVRAKDDTLAGGQSLFKPYARLARYARLKRDVAGGTEDLIAVFEQKDIAAAYVLVATLSRREAPIVKAVAEALWAAPALTTERPIQRLWDALQVVERLGVPVAFLARWTRIL